MFGKLHDKGFEYLLNLESGIYQSRKGAKFEEGIDDQYIG